MNQFKPNVAILEAAKKDSPQSYRAAIEENPLLSTDGADSFEAARVCSEELAIVASAFEEVLTEAAARGAKAAAERLEAARPFLLSHDAVVTFMTDVDGRVAAFVTGASGDTRRDGYRLGLADRPSDPASVAQLIAARCHAYARALWDVETTFSMSRADVFKVPSDARLEVEHDGDGYSLRTAVLLPRRPDDEGGADA